MTTNSQPIRRLTAMQSKIKCDLVSFMLTDLQLNSCLSRKK